MSNDLPNDCEQEDLIVGQTIVIIRPMTEAEMKIECLAWRDSCQAFRLKSGVDPDLALPSGLVVIKGPSASAASLRSPCAADPRCKHGGCSLDTTTSPAGSMGHDQHTRKE